MGTVKRGRPFEASVNSSDASAGVAVPLYEPGTSTVITLGADEYLEINWVHVITAVGGEVFLFVGPDASLGTNEEVIRGTYAANGGFAGDLVQPKVGVVAGTLWLDAPAGVVDVQVRGVIRKVDNTGARPSWRESQVPGQ